YEGGKNKVTSSEEVWYDPDAGSQFKPPRYNENEIDQSGKLDKNKIVIVPLTETELGTVPLLAAISPSPNRVYSQQDGEQPPRAVTNFTEAKDTRRYKTKLPVGLSSFFLGGVRGVSGRHWEMPKDLVEKLEFMPNMSPIVSSDYYPEDKPDH